jgi:TRAP-type C4-dicarboxylate transport system substrate-binding protein
MQQAIAEAIPYQRQLALEEEKKSEAAIRAENCEIVTLGAAEHAEFAAAVRPQLSEARGVYPKEILSFLPGL